MYAKLLTDLPKDVLLIIINCLSVNQQLKLRIAVKQICGEYNYRKSDLINLQSMIFLNPANKFDFIVSQIAIKEATSTKNILLLKKLFDMEALITLRTIKHVNKLNNKCGNIKPKFLQTLNTQINIFTNFKVDINHAVINKISFNARDNNGLGILEGFAKRFEITNLQNLLIFLENNNLTTRFIETEVKFKKRKILSDTSYNIDYSIPSDFIACQLLMLKALKTNNSQLPNLLLRGVVFNTNTINYANPLCHDQLISLKILNDLLLNASTLQDVRNSLSLGAQINAVDENGETKLYKILNKSPYLVSSNAELEIAKFLVSQNATYYCKSKPFSKLPPDKTVDESIKALQEKIAWRKALIAGFIARSSLAFLYVLTNPNNENANLIYKDTHFSESLVLIFHGTKLNTITPFIPIFTSALNICNITEYDDRNSIILGIQALTIIYTIGKFPEKYYLNAN